MKLSEAIRKWKRSITTHIAVEYVLALRADINAFSDAAQALELENAKLRELLQRSITTHDKMCTQRKNCFGCRFFGDFVCEPIRVSKEAEKLGIEVGE